MRLVKKDAKLKVSVKYVTKEYDLIKTKSQKIKSLIRGKKNDAFWALKGVSFDIYEGESVGIIGLNGSGKSTILDIISGIMPPTSGEVIVNGETNVISVGAGLNQNLTGRENIIMKSEMIGMSKEEIDSKIDDIIEFSELGYFIDQPVKGYSSGMRSKVDFSTLVYQNPDILIIDEALSVGDENFFQKGLKKMLSFKEEGKTIIFVSHNKEQVKQLCDKVIWLDGGEIKEIGEAEEVIKHYNDYNVDYHKMNETQRKDFLKKKKASQLNEGFNLESLRAKNPEADESLFKKTVADRDYTWFSKIALLGLIVMLVFTSTAYLKNIRLKEAITNPVEVFQKDFPKGDMKGGVNIDE